MADEYDPLSLLLEDAPGVPRVPKVNTTPDGRSWITRTLDRAAQRATEELGKETDRLKDPLNVLMRAVGLMPGGDAAAYAVDRARQGKVLPVDPKKIGPGIDAFAEGVTGSTPDLLETVVAETAGDRVGRTMRGHTRPEKEGGDMLQAFGDALGLGAMAPKPRPRLPDIDVPKKPPPTTVSKPFYPARLPDEIDRMPRTGAIKIPDRFIDDTVDGLAFDLAATNSASKSKDLVIRTADGAHRGLRGVSYPQPDARGWLGEFMESPPDGPPRVYLYADPGAKTARAAKRSARRTISHELTHAADPTPRAARTPSADYLNSTREVNAHIQEVVQDLRRNAEVVRTMRPDKALALTKTWNDIADSLTPANRRRFMRAAFDTLDSIRNPPQPPPPRPAWKVKGPR